MLEKVIFITLILIAIMSLYIIIKYFISNDKISHLLSQKITTKENKTYIIKIDYEYQLITFTRRGLDDEKKPSIISQKYSFNDFIESLPSDQQVYFYDFLFNDCKQDNKKAKITINVNKIFEVKDNNWLRLTYLERHSNNVIYLKGVKVYKRNVSKDRKIEYLTLDAFKNKINSMYPKVVNPVGSLYLFSFNSYDFYNKRYGVEVANDYLNQMWDELNTLFINRGFVGHVEDDKFIAFFDKKVNKREITYFIQNTCLPIKFEFGIDNLVRTNKPLIGAAIYGEFNKSLDVNISYLYHTIQKLEDSNKGLRHSVFDDEMYKQIKTEEERQSSMRQEIEEKLFTPAYSNVINLNSGKNYGYFPTFDSPDNKYNNIKDLLDSNIFGNSLFSKAVSKWFASFLNNSELDTQKLFIYTDFDMIDNLINTYTSNEEYDRINLVAVITDYHEILVDPDLTRRKINDLRRNGISLGIVASLELQSVLLQELSYFTYLVIPRQLTKNIITNPRNSLVLQTIFDMTHDYYMDKIAVEIDNYQEAEVLKDMDVFYMTGDLFNPKKSNTSMRRLTHLYDENN